MQKKFTKELLHEQQSFMINDSEYMCSKRNKQNQTGKSFHLRIKNLMLNDEN